MLLRKYRCGLTMLLPHMVERTCTQKNCMCTKYLFWSDLFAFDPIPTPFFYTKHLPPWLDFVFLDLARASVWGVCLGVPFSCDEAA